MEIHSSSEETELDVQGWAESIGKTEIEVYNFLLFIDNTCESMRSHINFLNDIKEPVFKESIRDIEKAIVSLEKLSKTFYDRKITIPQNLIPRKTLLLTSSESDLEYEDER